LELELNQLQNINKMKEQIIKAVSTLTPMSLVCWYVDEPRAAIAVFIIGFIATLERLEIKLNK
tara:strand:+ start:182 stop:370 length:189 start_codon:yes stop_codon:yes gene_type:complete